MEDEAAMMSRRLSTFFPVALFASLCLVLDGKVASAKENRNRINGMFEFIETGIPDCVDISSEYLTSAFVEGFRKFITRETGVNDGGVKISKERLAVADCGAFYTVTTVPPKNLSKNVVELGITYVFFFVKSMSDDEDLSEGNFSNYAFIIM